MTGRSNSDVSSTSPSGSSLRKLPPGVSGPPAIRSGPVEVHAGGPLMPGPPKARQLSRLREEERQASRDVLDRTGTQQQRHPSQYTLRGDAERPARRLPAVGHRRNSLKQATAHAPPAGLEGDSSFTRSEQRQHELFVNHAVVDRYEAKMNQKYADLEISHLVSNKQMFTLPTTAQDQPLEQHGFTQRATSLPELESTGAPIQAANAYHAAGVTSPTAGATSPTAGAASGSQPQLAQSVTPYTFDQLRVRAGDSELAARNPPTSNSMPSTTFGSGMGEPDSTPENANPEANSSSHNVSSRSAYSEQAPRTSDANSNEGGDRTMPIARTSTIRSISERAGFLGTTVRSDSSYHEDAVVHHIDDDDPRRNWQHPAHRDVLQMDPIHRASFERLEQRVIVLEEAHLARLEIGTGRPRHWW
ncbi:hypothetical protein BAUCODRAFT_152542 [Baudoinia panamericana UAMH 10762]|uniref:Uncharacterized protein n=1 Tax=Baudoinia panamericana (strain UAMH 10762) TaxID=717646 RepID=M2MX86_BAUPA|nr:uncharacterized protein BAUCODRAFT_152542 [Baudoinia panamericana UAMH 10762]EMC91264.1 hypothetical protein BAUCODRAFT_152542 [Baudoinia panamericana UAMH 10762]